MSSKPGPQQEIARHGLHSNPDPDLDPSTPLSGTGTDEDGDNNESSSEGKLGKTQLDTINTIMQSLCVALDNKLALVKKHKPTEKDQNVSLLPIRIKNEPALDKQPRLLHPFAIQTSPGSSSQESKTKSKKASVKLEAKSKPAPPPPPPRAPSSQSFARFSLRSVSSPRPSNVPPPATISAVPGAPIAASVSSPPPQPPPPSQAPAPASLSSRAHAPALTRSIARAAPTPTPPPPPPPPPLTAVPAPEQAQDVPRDQGSTGVQTADISQLSALFSSNFLHTQFLHLPQLPSLSFSSHDPSSLPFGRSESRPQQAQLEQRSLPGEVSRQRGPDPTTVAHPALDHESRDLRARSSGLPNIPFRQFFRTPTFGSRRTSVPALQESGEGLGLTEQYASLQPHFDPSNTQEGSLHLGFQPITPPTPVIQPPGLINLASTNLPSRRGEDPNSVGLSLLHHEDSEESYRPADPTWYPVPTVSSHEEYDMYNTGNFDFDDTELERKEISVIGTGHAVPSESPTQSPALQRAPDRDGRRNKRPKASDELAKKFACPYYKRDRKKYCNWTSCPGPGWEEVHRVKTHLYRRHARPPQCPRCWSVFSTDDSVKLHLQQSPPCEVGRNLGLVDGFSKEQEKKLRSRKKAQPNMTDEDKWRDIYLILFPDDDKESIPSAYYDETDADADETSPGPTGELDDYALFVRREMPTLVRRQLEMLFENEFKDIDVRIRPRIAQIVQDIQPKLLSLYKQSQLPLSEYGPQPPNTTTPGSGSEPANATTPGSGSEPGLVSSVPQTVGTDTNSTPGNSEDGVTQGTASLPYYNPSQLSNIDVNNMGMGFEWNNFYPHDQGTAALLQGVAGDDQGNLNWDDQMNLNWDHDFDQIINPALLFSAPTSGILTQATPTEGGKRKHDD